MELKLVVMKNNRTLVSEIEKDNEKSVRLKNPLEIVQGADGAYYFYAFKKNLISKNVVESILPVGKDKEMLEAYYLKTLRKLEISSRLTEFKTDVKPNYIPEVNLLH